MSNKLENETLAFLLNTSARLLHNAFERRIADAGLGLTPGEARTLVTIAAINGSKQSEIAARMGVEPMTVCAYLDRLQSLDVIERQTDPTDRRSKRVMLTQSSSALLSDVRAEIAELTAQATAGLSEAAVVALKKSLARLNENLQPDPLPPDTP
jgi:DNA-binding MarR family transcriptional regulator